MSIDATLIEDDDRWNSLVANADDATGFHRAGALSVIAEQSDTTLHRLAGFKGEEPCGLFPVFTKSVGPLAVAFSPPPNLKLNYLGPALLNVDKLKARRRELRHRRFVAACVEWLNENENPSFTMVRTAPGYDDVRPLVWNDFRATPRYTYVVDLEPPEDDLLAAFSSDARRNVTHEHDTEFVIEDGGHDAIRDIVTGATERHAEQGEPFPVTAEFVGALYDSLPDGVIRPVVLRSNGEFVGGEIVVGGGERAVCWLAYADRDHDLPVTDLLDWHCMRDAKSRGASGFDLAGANNKRLSRYKAKFAPTLTPYFRVESGSWPLLAASKLYARLN